MNRRATWSKVPLALILLVGCSPLEVDEAGGQPAGHGSQPSPALSRLAEALLTSGSDRQILCLGELHGSSADADLRSAVFRHPTFPMRFGQVLFEGASAAHQDVIDRYVFEGGEVEPERLARVWRDAGRGLQWRLPHYRRLFDELRKLNQSLPLGRRVRLLGGAPPIPWNTMRSPAELAPWIDRKGWMHARLRALAGEERSTLAVYGRHHCERLRFDSTQDLGPAVRSALSVGPSEDTEFRRRLGLPDTNPQIVAMGAARGRELVRDTWGEGHLFRGSRFDEIADLVISYGGLDHRVFVVHEEDLPPNELDELRRRDEWMAIALSASPSEASR